MLIVKAIKLQQSTIYYKSFNIKIKNQLQDQSKIYYQNSKIYNLAGSTHLKICDSCGITNLSEILAIRPGNFIK